MTKEETYPGDLAPKLMLITTMLTLCVYLSVCTVLKYMLQIILGFKKKLICKLFTNK